MVSIVMLLKLLFISGVLVFLGKFGVICFSLFCKLF